MYYKAWVTRVVDGDTLEALIETWPKDFKQATIRLDGVDAPETRGDEKERGQMSTAWVREQLAHCESVEVEPLGDGGFSRVLCRVFYKNEHGHLRSLSEELLKADMAVVYSRGTIAIDGSPIQSPGWV